MLVMQVGLPASSEQYIHRLGRTARAGAAGRGILILSPEEQFFLNTPEIRSLPLRAAAATTPPVNAPPSSTPSTSTASTTTTSLTLSIRSVSLEIKTQAYRA